MATEGLRQSEIALRMGVTRNYVHQLRRERGFPRPIRDGIYYDLAQVRRYLRQRALRRHPEAVFCIACGSDLIATS